MQPAAEIIFGMQGNATERQISGWSVPEDGYTWGLGPESVLRIPLRPGQGDLLADFTLRPFMIPPYRSSQRIGLSVDGTAVATERVHDDSAVGFRIPAALVAGRTEIELTLHFPDALRPCDAGAGGDTRNLGCQLRDLLLIWAAPEPDQAPVHLPPLPVDAATPPARAEALVRGFTGLPLEHLMLRFESLGANCEFGLVQRRFGAEPLGLLRFVGIDVQTLLAGLDFGFEGMDEPSTIRAYTDGGEAPSWVSVNDRYGIHRQSYQPAAAMTETAFLAAEMRKLKLERRRFLEVLEHGTNLFVYQRQESLSPAHVWPILNMLRSHGRNALLFVTLNYEALPGSVDMLAPDLYRGNIDRLAPIANARDCNLPAWISLCANAYRLWRQTGHGSETETRP